MRRSSFSPSAVLWAATSIEEAFSCNEPQFTLWLEQWLNINNDLQRVYRRIPSLPGTDGIPPRGLESREPVSRCGQEVRHVLGEPCRPLPVGRVPDPVVQEQPAARQRRGQRRLLGRAEERVFLAADDQGRAPHLPHPAGV